MNYDEWTTETLKNYCKNVRSAKIFARSILGLYKSTHTKENIKLAKKLESSIKKNVCWS